MNLTKEEVELLIKGLWALSDTADAPIGIWSLKEHLEAELVDRVTYAPYVQAADEYLRVDGEIEIDQEASVSASEDVEEAGGIYVAGWVWVSNELVDPETEGATS